MNNLLNIKSFLKFLSYSFIKGRQSSAIGISRADYDNLHLFWCQFTTKDKNTKNSERKLDYSKLFKYQSNNLCIPSSTLI